MDKGPWKALGIDVVSDDFERDVMLRIYGDFGDEVVARKYANWLANELNSIADLRAQLAARDAEVQRLIVENKNLQEELQELKYELMEERN